jgi:lipid-binding SYLF domain-containing protein
VRPREARLRSRCVQGLGLIVGLSIFAAAPASAETASEIEAKAETALKALYEKTPAAAELAKVAKGILVFPQVLKAGFIFGAEYGNGVLFEGGEMAGHYNTTAVSYGLQAGVQSMGYAMFFVTDSSLEYLKKSHGWEFGAGPTLTVVDAGVATQLSSSTLKSDIYAFFFSQKGLMAGIGLEGTKITETHPDP